MSLPRPRITGPRDGRRLGPLDPRTAAWRGDLADLALAATLAAPAYAAPVLRSIAGEAAMLLDAPDLAATAVSELLPGEDFAVLEVSGDWAWGWSAHDHYVGYLPADALGPALAPTHMAGPGDALLFAAPAIKAPVLATLPAASRLLAQASPSADFVLAGGAGFMHRAHLLPPGGDRTRDWVGMAETYLGSPYRWGGRSRRGIDCSGLVQVARMLAGLPTRRDSDMQAADAAPVAAGEARRGDIATWPGHVGILLDATRLLHATAFAMAVIVEPLEVVAARVGPPRLGRFQDAA